MNLPRTLHDANESKPGRELHTPLAAKSPQERARTLDRTFDTLIKQSRTNSLQVAGAFWQAAGRYLKAAMADGPDAGASALDLLEAVARSLNESE